MNRVENQLSLFPSLSLSLSFSLFLSLSLVSNMAPESGRFSIESEMHQAVALERPPRIDGQFPLWHHHPFRQDLKGKIYGGRPRLAFSFYTNIYIYSFSVPIFLQGNLVYNVAKVGWWQLIVLLHGRCSASITDNAGIVAGKEAADEFQWRRRQASTTATTSCIRNYHQHPNLRFLLFLSSTPSPSAPHCCHRNRHHNLAVMSPFLIYELTRFNGFAASAKKERKCSNFINKGFKVFIQILQLRFGNHSFLCCCCCCCSCCWRSRLLDL